MIHLRAFLEALTTKYRKWTKSIDLSLGQDSWDTRGIYISAPTKVKKYLSLEENWHQISYQRLSHPVDILRFLTSDERLGIVEPQAIMDLLIQRGLTSEAGLMERIRSSYLEEVIVNPPLLYPS